jgi:predicted porin
MKKTLVLASLLAAFGAASAQSSVTLYGVADAYIGQSKLTTTNPVTGLNSAGNSAINQSAATTAASNGVSQSVINSGGQYGSRFGIRGSEALGNGLNAIFTMEQGVGLDSGAGGEGAATVFSRQAFAGFEGGFGKLTFGRQYTSYDSVRGGFDPLGHSSFSSSTAWAAGRHYTWRLNNSMRYDSANYSGFTFGATYGVGENKTATTGASKVSALSAKYAAGPFAVAIATQTEKGVVTGSGGGNTDWNFTASNKESHTTIQGSYNFGVAKATLGYNTSSDNSVSGFTSGGVATGGTKEKELMFGLNIPFGAASVDFGYSTGKENTWYKAKALGVHVNYALSPRTVAYVGINDTTVTGLNAASNSAKRSLAAVGFRHSF